MFKTPKHRSFDYKPVYFDEQKERKKELELLAKEAQSGNISDERRIELLRGKLHHKWAAGSRTSRAKQSSGQKLRFVFILAALCGLVWFFFNWG
mgnify:CR=1 FL=1